MRDCIFEYCFRRQIGDQFARSSEQDSAPAASCTSFSYANTRARVLGEEAEHAKSTKVSNGAVQANQRRVAETKESAAETRDGLKPFYLGGTSCYSRATGSNPVPTHPTPIKAGRDNVIEQTHIAVQALAWS